MEKIVKKIVEKIGESKKIAITSHIRPDGDSIGSSLALYLMLKQLGKEVKYINKDKPQPPISYFANTELIEYRDIYPEDFDIVILIECSTEERSGQKHLNNYFRILIDHHRSNDGQVELNWVDPDKSAVAIMVYQLGIALGIKFDKTIASLLYSGLVSDTGGFKFTNVNAESFQAAAALVKLGADPVYTNRLLFENYTKEKVLLISKVLGTLETYFDETVGFIFMFKSFLEELGLSDVETEDIVTIIRSIHKIKLVMFFKENDDRSFRVSLRSRNNIDSSIIAESFGGGGHLHASGFYVEGDIEDIKKITLKRIKNYLETGKI
jgi:phosphoesterase RecJ-like protein